MRPIGATLLSWYHMGKRSGVAPLDEQRLVSLMAQTIRSIVTEELQAFEERMLGKIQESEERMLGKIQESENRMDDKLQKLEIRLTARLEVLETAVSDLRSDIAALSARVDLIKEAVDSLDERMAKGLAYLGEKWLEHDKEIWQLKRKL